MPPSTVFSYWRRDHRRSSASPVSSSARVNGVSNVPQLPVVPNSTALPTTFSSEGLGTQVSSDYQAEVDLSKDNIAVSTAAINAPSSSSATLAVPSSSDKDVRPHSSPEERERDLSLTPQSNYSQPSFAGSRLDHVEGDSSKPNSPFRLSFGKGLLNSHSQSSDSHLKRSSTPDMAQSGHSRFKAPPDESATERIIAPRRDHRYESTISRRQGDRDVSAEPVHHKSGKAMLHLLNPMSLLARRRSSQVAGRTEDANIRARSVIPAIPDDYDPRIRGNIIHDFSAPRPRRNLSAAPVLLHGVTNRHSSHEPSQAANGTQSCTNDWTAPLNDQRKRHSEYSPVFREHFEEDQKALQVENKAYLQSSLLTNPSNHENDAKSVPVFARNLPSSLPDPDREPPTTDNNASTKGQEAEPTNDGAPLDADTVEIVPHQPLGLPKHLKSNASRFSFDMNGVESSTQEKLLEEKHKEKEAARRAKARLEGEFSDAEDDFDNDLIDDMDDLEEKIPGVNVDADEEYDFDDFSGPGDILNKSWLAPGLSPVISSPSSPNAPSMVPSSNAQSGQTLAPELERSQSSSTYDTAAAHLNNETLSNHKAEAIPQSAAASPSVAPQMTANTHLNTSQLLVDEEDDDLYFDDGEFGDLTADIEGEKFDESIFDDETSHLYERKPAGQRAASVRQEEPNPGIGDAMNERDGLSGHDGGLKHVPSMASDYREVVPRMYGHEEVIPELGPAKSYGGVLSEHNLEALHSALAKAANDSATNDRFGRSVSVSEQSLGHESVTQTVDSHSGLVSDDSHLSQLADVVGVESVFEDFDYDDNDSALYDDPIIAAANAEALENDDEGFYGQEFGFYAQAYGNCTSELTNGGYFGPRGIEGITRSFSSRGKFREPSLTPITERSEWSTRNSVISLAAHGAAHSNPLSSPGLAQLVDMGSIEDEMTLSALLRLRRGAWGGSNGSLRSSSGSPPPNPHPSSNRGSFTGLSDVSPTVYNAPPDAFGGTSATDSPIDKWGPPHNLSQQQNSIEGE